MCEKRTGSLVLGHYVRAVCLLPLSLPLPLSMPHNGPPHKRAKSTSIEMHQLRTHTHTPIKWSPQAVAGDNTKSYYSSPKCMARIYAESRSSGLNPWILLSPTLPAPDPVTPTAASSSQRWPLCNQGWAVFLFFVFFPGQRNRPLTLSSPPLYPSLFPCILFSTLFPSRLWRGEKRSHWKRSVRGHRALSQVQGGCGV